MRPSLARAIASLLIAILASAAGAGRSEDGGALERGLLLEDPAALARAAREQGDPGRGALVFHQPSMGCAKCHLPAGSEPPLGPDLAAMGNETPDVQVIEAVLRPSKVVKKGFETVTVTTREAGVITGLLVEGRPGLLVLRDASSWKTLTLREEDIAGRASESTSIMPEGLVSQLASRQQFLDLASYLLEIAAKGPARALELRPDPSLFAPAPLPAYEKDIDHAGMIAALDGKSFRRGEALYNRACINCHGTREAPGTLPTSLRFGSGRFRNGCDPHAMYQTLTRGFGLMQPQDWMVPREKYDVIHYIREAYLRDLNPTQYARAGSEYLRGLPGGKSRGPEPASAEPWSEMDYGPDLTGTFEIGADGSNIAYKGIAVRLDPGPGGIARGRHWMVFEHDTLRVAGGWSGTGFIDWNGINFNGRHEVHPRIAGRAHFANPAGPGWGRPGDGSFADPRSRGRDGRAYGPLPREWGRYRGLYHFGSQVVIAYSVGKTDVLEMPALESAGALPVFTRTLNIGPRSQPLVLQVANRGAEPGGREARLRIVDGQAGGEGRLADFSPIIAALSSPLPGAAWIAAPEGSLRLGIPAGAGPLRLKVKIARAEGDGDAEQLVRAIGGVDPAMDLAPLTRGGAPRWPREMMVKGEVGPGDGPFAADVLRHPVNPWSCLMRFTGFDFLQGGKAAAICTWDGDVWRVTGIDRPEEGVAWRRIASGLFQPLGLKLVDGRIHVACRDQIAILHDLDGDGEADFHQCFNSDHQVTEHFHEFAMGLQVDAEGNLYYAKSARHARPAIVPQHGTLLRVSKDGSRTEIVAQGFRAANGVCINADGTFFVTDQEGHWTPKNRINWVREGRFYGNMLGYHSVEDASDAAMESPLCWITNTFDRSPAELVRVSSEAWGPLEGSLLNISYGHGRVYVVPHEVVNGQMQGGMCPLPLATFPTGVMRGRFSPLDGQLYLCGMYAWAGNQTQPGGFYRVRATGKPFWVPIGLAARAAGMEIAFSAPLDAKKAADPARYAVKVWSLKRTSSYGSEPIGERSLKVAGVQVMPGARRVLLEIPDLRPTWCMEIRYSLLGEGGEPVEGVIHNTVHELGG